MNALRNDSLFRGSCLFADLVLFMMLCYIAVLGVTTGAAVIFAGILVTAIVFVALCEMTMNQMNYSYKAVHA